MRIFVEARNDLKKLCEERGIKVIDGEYQVLLSICKTWMAERHNMPKEFAGDLIYHLLFHGYIEVKRGRNSRRWYVIIKEGIDYSKDKPKKETVDEE